jgi:isoaspartyl peptidase/L-asparaginase-like protein (Ntn-hydrolase superfamily)
VHAQTPHTLLVGNGADQFARELGIPTIPTDQLITQEAKNEFEIFQGKFSKTVHNLFNTTYAFHFEQNFTSTIMLVCFGAEILVSVA